MQFSGLAIFDARDLSPVHEVPFQYFVDTITPATGNPSWLELDGGVLRLWVAPGQGSAGAIYAYETAAASDPFPYLEPAAAPPLSELPEPDALTRALLAVSQDSPWTRVNPVRLSFNVFEPEGLAKVGNDFFMSSADKPNGIGYLFRFDVAGNLQDQLTFPETARFHAGGIDYDGRGAAGGKRARFLGDGLPRRSGHP